MSGLTFGQYSLTVSEYSTAFVPGLTTYRVYVDLVNSDDFLSSVYGNSNDPLSFSTSSGFYNDPFGSTVGSSINGAFIAFVPSLGGDSWFTIGIDSQPVGEEVAVSSVEDTGSDDAPGQPYISAFAAGSSIDGQDILVNTQTGGAWYILNGTPNGLPDSNGQVLIMQFSTSGSFSGVFNVQIFGNGDGQTDIRKSFAFDGVGTFFDEDDSGSVSGCTDETACNFSADATDDDGSCSYAAAGFDCDGNCLNDADGDGVCDEFEVAGCTDATACNYDVNATDDNGSCQENDECGVCGGDGIADGACDCEGNGPQAGYDCDGNCLNDAWRWYL